MKRAGEIMLLDPAWAPLVASIDNDEPGTNGTATNEEREEWFAKWWEIVWVKIGFAAAKKSFIREAKNVEIAREIYRATKKQTPAILQRAADSSRGTAIMPATWLNQQRWKDEPIAELPAPTPSRMPTVVAVDPALIEKQRREITPEQVAALNATTLAMWRRELEIAIKDGDAPWAEKMRQEIASLEASA